MRRTNVIERDVEIIDEENRGKIVIIRNILFKGRSLHAKYGWYRYNTRFALPVYDEDQKLEEFNIFQAVLLIRHAHDGKRYLYDIVNIKKETSKPPGL